jgi:signal transduction histidine kinase
MAAEGVKNHPSPSEAPSVPSTERLSVVEQLPADWLERLLVVQCQLRADTPFEDAVTQILGAARELCPDAALGVCVPRAALPASAVDTTSRLSTSSTPPFGMGAIGDTLKAPPPVFPAGSPHGSGQIVIRLAPTRPSNPVDADPSRLFPELGFEKVISFVPDQGASLHGAADDEKLFGHGTAASLLLDRLGAMLAALVDNHGALDRSLRDLRRQVIQSEKLASLGQIAAGIVHELNNPLTTIVAYSDFLRRKLAARGDPADVERLARINEAADRILRFSRDLTAYSRPANEVPAPVAIHDVIERALVFCEHELDKKGVMIERSFGQVRPVRGVAGQLTQVFVNLFTNAAHAMRDRGGLLTITTSMTDGDADGAPVREVLVSITDDGHGIDEGHIERIFEPFFTTKTDGSGTGLGLSIVRSIVQSHGGRISVTGKQPHGTVFLLELPPAAAPDEE